MGKPQHPDTIVIKNEYYPRGLREIDVWNYYQKVKNPLLKETLGKNIIVFFAIDVNKFTVIRHMDNKLLRLNMTSFDNVNTGRAVSIHNVMNKYSPYGVIDIDTDDFRIAKDLAVELYHLFYKQKFVYDVKLIYTGKNSFHIRVYFNNEYKIEYVKQKLSDVLKGTDVRPNLRTDYTVKAKRERNIPNLDLQRNIFNAGFIALNSLSVDGLMCIEIDTKKIGWFRKEQAKII